MLTIKRETAIYAMSPENAPVAHAANGDQIVFETTDCFGGQITKETDRMGGLDWSRINPATGPVFVEGAERDTRYETPYGRMMLTLDTHRIDWDEKKRRLYIRYNVLTDGALVSMNEITIEIKERKQYEKSGQ